MAKLTAEQYELLNQLDNETIRAVELAKEFMAMSGGLFDEDDIPAFVAGYMVRTQEGKQNG